MRGSITPRGNAFEVVVSSGFDPITKKRVRHYATAATRAEAERELTKLLREMDTGTVADPGRLTYGAFVADQWLPHLEARNLGDRTVPGYRRLLVNHVLPRIGSEKLAKLRPAHVQSMLDSLTVGPMMRLHVHRVVKASLQHAVRIRLLSTNPAEGVSPPRADRRKLAVPDAGEVMRLVDAADGWLRTALMLSAHTGMRRGEVLALQWRTIDLELRTARLEQALVNTGPAISVGPLKKDRQRRTISLPPSLVGFLRTVKKDQAERRLLLGSEWQGTDLIVERGDGGVIHPDRYSTRFSRLATKVGLPDVRLHDLRHAYATMLLLANVHPKIVSEALGHGSTAFTMDVYSAYLPSMGETASAAIEAALTFLGRS
jgi:integrase